MKLQITEHGRKRVASEDFAKTLVHVIAMASAIRDQEESFAAVATYVAMNLVLGEDMLFEIPQGVSAAKAHRAFVLGIADFVNENGAFIRSTIHSAIESPAFLAHAIETQEMRCANA